MLDEVARLQDEIGGFGVKYTTMGKARLAKICTKRAKQVKMLKQHVERSAGVAAKAAATIAALKAELAAERAAAAAAAAAAPDEESLEILEVLP